MAGTHEQVHPDNAGMKLTYDDFVLFPDDGKRHELIGGEHYVSPSPVTRHQAIVQNVNFRISAYLEVHPLGYVFGVPLDVVFTPFDVVEPDIQYLSHARATQVLSEKHLTGAPELVVEVLSPGTRKRDETLKKKLYEREGVREYWTIDPDVEIVRIYRATAGRYAETIELRLERDEVITTPLLPDFALPLRTVFATPHIG